ncbi:oligopeptide ABC transporter ATP-binding protein AmiF [Streptococcus pneumoniae]|nr:oligopeptide ABC transporter ATP-binding protein AmiF [Streptococcus pneumoniae]
MSEKLVEIKDLEISFGEGSKKFVAVKMLTSLSTREKLSRL